ncbi:hypothetical protein TRVA0_002S02080 [Trichomonascus vanleenenianus]|uniref:uncharacterized protein n=1 Tax=Trichomonascus vanleenenianus TaxID=2268995 RepID=UPI003ECAE75A
MTKRPRLDIQTRVVTHPLGVKPEGNSLLSLDVPFSRHQITVLGPYFGMLPDHLIMDILQEIKDPKDLLNLGYISKAMFAFCWFDELWKAMMHNRDIVPDKWYGSWRRTYWKLSPDQEARVDASGIVFSDYLYRPFQCAHINYRKLVKLHENPANRGDSDSVIPTFEANEMTQQKYEQDEWYKRPFVVRHEKPIADWTLDSLLKRFGDVSFRQEYMDWKLKVYAEYMQHNVDESPLYLFDCGSTVTGEELSKEYEVPLSQLFGPEKDFFELLGDSRPDHRWLIIGPDRSGSTFHKDPNGTSAWNSLVTGMKYWIMFPPKTVPPGVTVDDQEEEVTAPYSVSEWFLSGFYEQAQNTPGFHHGFTFAGQTMYVPSGWWHLVVNIGQSIALTGNFVPRVKLGEVLHFLKYKRNQISGFCDSIGEEKVYATFLDKLRAKDSELADEKEREAEEIEDRKTGKWQKLVSGSSGFSFNFNNVE